MEGRTLALLGTAVAAIVALAALGTWRFAFADDRPFAHRTDVNINGRVDITDIGHVVRDFGRVLDSCDDVQQLIKKLPEKGGQVVIPMGTYTCTEPIVIGRDDVDLRGEGAATVLRLADGVNSPVILVGSTDPNPEQLPPVRNVRISDLTVDGNRLNQASEDWDDFTYIRNNGIDLRHVSDVSVERVTVHSARSGGLVTERVSRRVTVRDFTAYDNHFDGLAGYLTEDSIFSGIYLYNNCAAGLSFDDEFNRNLLSDILIRHEAGTSLCGEPVAGGEQPQSDGKEGVFMRDSRDNVFQGLAIRGTPLDGVYLRPHTFNDAPTAPSGNTFTGLVIADSAGAGLSADDPSVLHTVVVGGQFIGNAGGCIVEVGDNVLDVGTICRP